MNYVAFNVPGTPYNKSPGDFDTFVNSPRSPRTENDSEESSDFSLNNRRNVVISGVGLIGGSIGLALRALQNPPQVIGLGRNLARLQQALELGAVDRYTTDWAEAISDDSLVVLCGPVSSIVDQAVAAWQNRGGHSIIVTDAGSTKQEIVERIAGHHELADVFVGAHPIAGSERSGVQAARPDLFLNRACVVTPSETNSDPVISEIQKFWRSLGCSVLQMTPKEHDQALALTSHMPHVLSAILVRCVPEELHRVSAGAFRDMTRIAGADATLWNDIFLSNRTCLENSLDLITREMLNFREILSKNSSTELIQWWNEARQRRNSLENSVHGPGNGSSCSRPE